MRFSIRFADKVVGTLVILALAILIFVIFMLGRNQRWFAHDVEYKAYFSSASGISPNMPIQHRGFTIGHVKSLSLADDDRVEVIFTIFEEYSHRVTEGSLVEVQVSPIGLGNAFLFFPGRGTEQLPEGEEIPEINSMQARFLISMGMTNIPRATDGISNIMNQVNATLDTINVSLSGGIGAEDYPLGQMLLNLEMITDSLNIVLKNIETITDRASDPSGTVMSILDSDGAFYSGIEDLLASLSNILDSEGTLYSSLERAIASLAGIVENLEETSEFLPAMFPQLGILVFELNSTIRTLQDVLTAVANNPLLRGGIPERREVTPGGASPRNLEF